MDRGRERIAQRRFTHTSLVGLSCHTVCSDGNLFLIFGVGQKISSARLWVSFLDRSPTHRGTFQIHGKWFFFFPSSFSKDFSDFFSTRRGRQKKHLDSNLSSIAGRFVTSSHLPLSEAREIQPVFHLISVIDFFLWLVCQQPWAVRCLSTDTADTHITHTLHTHAIAVFSSESSTFDFLQSAHSE